MSLPSTIVFRLFVKIVEINILAPNHMASCVTSSFGICRDILLLYSDCT